MVDILDYVVFTVFKQFVNCLNAMFLAPGVSVLGFVLAVALVLIIGGMLILR